MKDWDDDRLLQAYLDRTLSLEESLQLEQRFCDEPDLAERLIEFANDDIVLQEWATGQNSESDGMFSKDEAAVRVARTPENPQQKHWRMLPVILSGFCLMLATGLFILTKTDKLTGSQSVILSTGEKVQNHIRQTLAEGSAELHFPTGAKVLISAPAAYEVTGNNSIHLQEGKFIANVPSTGIGFQVDTPHGRVIDLGTLFSVQTDEAQDTRVQVYKGKVIASIVDREGVVKSSRQVDENQSAKMESHNNEFADTPESHLLAAEHGISRYSPSVIFQEEMPDALATGKYQVFEHDDLAFIFPERHQVVLPQELRVLTSPTKAEQQAGVTMNYPVFIPPQTKVDCFRVYYDPALQEGAFLPVRGEIEFQQPILGVILDIKSLSRTDRYFHPLCKNDPQRSMVHQGTEVYLGQNDPDLGPFDEVEISEDRKKLTFILLSGERFVDEFRVLVKSAD